MPLPESGEPRAGCADGALPAPDSNWCQMSEQQQIVARLLEQGASPASYDALWPDNFRSGAERAWQTAGAERPCLLALNVMLQ